jgi:hypothetical protein
MPTDPLQQVREALKAGDRKTAQEILRPHLQYQPTAEMWYLAAQACATDEKAIQCLRKALELQPQHSGANRMLLKLEGAVPKTAPLKPPVAPASEAAKPKARTSEVFAQAEPLRPRPDAEAIAARPPKKSVMPSLEKLTEEPLKKVKRRKKRSVGRTIVLLSFLLFAMCCSLVTMNLVGLITGPITLLTQALGGSAPVTQIDGVPIDEMPDAPVIVPSSMTKPLAENRDANVLDPGYVHEYVFEATDGWEMAVYVQFLSLGANQVSRNVVLLRPNGSDATGDCERNSILQGDNNVTLICPIDATGNWKVRILGRAQESVGAYFVGAERMDG